MNELSSFDEKFLHDKFIETEDSLFFCIHNQPGAQEKFLDIKNAYQTLVDSKSRSHYDARNRSRSNDWDPFQWSSSSGSSRKSTQEEFYGIGTFLISCCFKLPLLLKETCLKTTMFLSLPFMQIILA